MAEMNEFSRHMVNRRTATRARRALGRLGDHLHIQDSDRVLELGSGGGGLLALLAERYHPARLVGTDFDPAQVEAARAFLSAQPGDLLSRIELRTADAFSLPFPDSSFDCVFAMMMLHHVEAHFREFDRRPKALEEIRRVLRAGGRLVYSDLFRRKEIRATLAQLGFVQEYLRAGFRTDLGIYRSPSESSAAHLTAGSGGSPTPVLT